MRREALIGLVVVVLVVSGLVRVSGALPPGWGWLTPAAGLALAGAAFWAVRQLVGRLELDVSGRLRERELWPLRGSQVDLSHLDVVAVRSQTIHRGTFTRPGQRTVLILRDTAGGSLWCEPAEWDDDGRLLDAVRTAVGRTDPEVVDGHLLDLDGVSRAETEAATDGPRVHDVPGLQEIEEVQADIGRPLDSRLTSGHRIAGAVGMIVPVLLVLPDIAIVAVTVLLLAVTGAPWREILTPFAPVLIGPPIGWIPGLLVPTAVFVAGLRAITARVHIDPDGRLTVRSVWPWRRRHIDLRTLARVRAQRGWLVGHYHPTRVVLIDRAGGRLVVVVDAWRDSGRLREQLAGWTRRTDADIDTVTARWLATGAAPSEPSTDPVAS